MVGLTGEMAKSQEEVERQRLPQTETFFIFFSFLTKKTTKGWNFLTKKQSKVGAAVAAGLARSSPSIVNVIIRCLHYQICSDHVNYYEKVL